MPHTLIPHDQVRPTIIATNLKRAGVMKFSDTETNMLVNLSLLTFGFANDFDIAEYRASLNRPQEDNRMPIAMQQDRAKLEAELSAQRQRLEVLKRNTSSKAWLSSPTVKSTLVNINRLEHAIASCGDTTPNPPGSAPAARAVHGAQE